MEKDKLNDRIKKEFSKDIQRKLNRGMKWLLTMSDEEIITEIKRDTKKIEEKKREIDKIVQELLSSEISSEQDVNTYERIKEIKLQKKGLLPHPVFSAVIRPEILPIKIRAIVRFTGNRKDLVDLGIEVRSQAQDVFTIIGTRENLKKLAQQPACRRLRTPRIMMSIVEQASEQAQVEAVHDPRPANPTGYEGDGVLVGIIDSDLDITHHGFRDPAGTHDTRVLYYWVQSPHTRDIFGNPDPQTPPGQTPQQFYNANPATSPDFTGFNYGRLYTDADINTALAQANPYGTGNNQVCCEPADEEHGTHCAGIAVGSGHENNWATAPTHVGAAPNATIVYVRPQFLTAEIDTDATSEDAILDAINFCLEVGRFHGMSVVVSVSLGNNFGPHNGTTDFDLARDNLLNSFNNRSIVFASGNDNNDNGYRPGNVSAGNTDNFTLTPRRNTPIWLDVWNTGPELDYRISFGGNDSGWCTAGQDYLGNISGRDFEAERDLDIADNLRGIRIYVDNSLAWDNYTIELRNPHASQNASYHAWTGLQGWWANVSGSIQHELTLADTACAKSILTVGACAKVIPPNPVTGETITDYSGAGPTVDGRIKPEIVTVGGINAARIMSADSDQNSGYFGNFGTSMATPLVAGAVALLFEAYNAQGYDPNQDCIKALLTQHANRQNINIDPSQAGYDPEDRNRYGYGRMRLINPIDITQPPIDVDLWIRTASDDYGEEPYPGGCFCGAPDVRVFNEGTNNETTNITWGTTYDVRVTVRNLGDSPAVDADLQLKYALPHTAPNAWFEAEDVNDQKLIDKVTIPAMDQVEVLFKWHPESSELSAPSGSIHFCLLAEVDHTADPLVFPAPTTAGGSAWTSNIKGVNNVALRNLHIQ